MRPAMPKMKTHSGAKKRFKVTATGKVRGRHAFTSHILEKKSPKRKRALAAPAAISAHDEPRAKRLLVKGAGKAPHRVGTAGRFGDASAASVARSGQKPAGGDPK
jgi:large subunit ribosomal protein L35